MKQLPTHKLRSLLLMTAVSAVAVLSPSTLPAANVTLTASDGVNTSSLNAAGNWSNGQAPSGANDYLISGFFMRTPPTVGSPLTYTFAGNSLTLANGNVRNIIFKGVAGDVIVINNLTNAFRGILENGGSGNQVVIYTGNRYTIAGHSAIYANQGPIILGYPLVGADGVILTNAGGNVITYTNDNSGFTGKFYISTINFGNGSGNTTVALNGPNSMPGNPSVFTPDQILLQGGCTLRDDFGLTLNNSRSGITLEGNATINTPTATTIALPIAGAFTLTKAGAGMLTLSSSSNTYAATTISAGILKLGVNHAIPAGAVTANGSLDLNGFSATISSLSGSGSVDNSGGGTSMLTVGTNGGSGTFTGSINNSIGALSLTKIGAGTQTLAGGYTYSGTTLVSAGTLNISTELGIVPFSPGDLIVSGGATLGINTSAGFATLPANNLVLNANATLSLSAAGGINGIAANGTLTLQDNATINVNYGSLMANPTGTAIQAAGAISAPGTNITINVSGVGFQPGTVTLIKYTGTPLGSIANFNLVLSPGIFASLVNNTANQSIDLNIVGVSKQLTWHGAAGANWDLSSVNWKDAFLADTIYQQYTNGSIVAGDGVTFDDTVYNDFINPQPTNINVTAVFSPYPLVVNSTLPYVFSGSGGISGTASLVKSNTGSLTLLTSNSFTGGVSIYGGAVIVTNDSALGAAGVAATLGGGTLGFGGNASSTRPISMAAASTIDVASTATVQITGGVSGPGTLTKAGGGTLVLGGINAVGGRLSVNEGSLSIPGGTSAFSSVDPSYVGFRTGTAGLVLSSGSTLNLAGELRVGGSDQNGVGMNASGTVTMSGGIAYLNALTLARGNNFENPCFGQMTLSGGTVWCTNDLLAGFAGTGTGTLNISGSGTVNVGPAATKWFILGRWDTSGGNVSLSGGNLNLMNNTSIKFSPGNGATSGTNVFTQSGGTITYYSDGGTNQGGTGDLNLAQSGSVNANNTYNLDGGLLIVPQVGSASSNPRRVFNFNGGTLKAARANETFMNLGSGNAAANVRNGGAVIDDGGFNITIAQALVHSTLPGDNATDGGLTKNGPGRLSLTGANTYTGVTTVNAGTLLVTTASGLSGGATIADGATFSMVQLGSATKTMAALTLNGSTAPGAALGLALTAANNPTVPVIQCGTLTLQGTNTINLAGSVSVGTIALIRATGVIAGSGNITNIVLPQGASGSITSSFDGTHTTISAVITSTGPGLVWTGGINNVWDINASTNWLLNSTVTKYQQAIIPGDAVTFNDTGSGTVLLSNSVGPASLLISNSSKAYTFSGNGSLSGPAGLTKLGSGTAVVNLANSSYTGDTVVGDGTLQVGSASTLPSTVNLIVNSAGKLQLSGFSLSAKELTGSGTVDNGSGTPSMLTIGDSGGGTWNGTITNTGGGGFALHKTGTGTWLLGGKNFLNSGQTFTDENQINQGTVILTNGSLLSMAFLEFQIANGAGQTGTVVVAGGTLIVTNNLLSIGYGSDTADGTLIVNSGTVDHSGYSGGTFIPLPNSITVGAQGANGTLIVNGGQVLNDQPLYLGDGATANGRLHLNGGLLKASVLQPNGTPASSIAYFNGGTLLAATNSASFLQVQSMVMSNGLVLDDGGFELTIGATSLQAGDAFNGGLVKKGAGTVYLDAFNSYSGTTLVTNGTLAGSGGVSGPVVVAPSGNLFPGNASPAVSLPFSINNNLTLQGAATFRISKDGGFPLNDQIVGLATVNYGGTLVISNVTADATPLAAGDTFTLFNGATHNGNFTSIIGSPGSGLAYSFANGVLSVVSGTASYPTNITFSRTGNTLTLSWPATHLGWILQSQTNAANVGLQSGSSAWHDVPGSGSATSANVVIDPLNPSVFYRLRLP